MQRYIPVSEWPSEGVEFIAPRLPWSQFEVHVLPAFSPVILEFVDCLSERLRCFAHAEPDMAAFGFWLRPAALRQQAIRMQGRAPLGMVFHLVPSNVPMVAFYSWMMALLMGNSSVIRLSSRLDPAQEKMLALLNELFSDPRWWPIGCRTRFIRYPHDERITSQLSAACSLRILWGGDEAIRQIRLVPLAPQAQELVFPDRRSLALIDTHWLTMLDEVDWHCLVAALRQDCCRFNQQACSSPTTFIWIGKPTASLRQRLLCDVFEPLAQDAGMAVQRLINMQRHLSEGGRGNIEQFPGATVLTIDEPEFITLRYPGCGVISEWIVTELQSVVISDINVQTCLWIGAQKDHFLQVLSENPGCRIDRVVSPGQALAFDWFWDGQDFLASCSRCIKY